jgi:hypothetical protein
MTLSCGNEQARRNELPSRAGDDTRRDNINYQSAAIDARALAGLSNVGTSRLIAGEEEKRLLPG